LISAAIRSTTVNLFALQQLRSRLSVSNKKIDPQIIRSITKTALNKDATAPFVPGHSARAAISWRPATSGYFGIAYKKTSPQDRFDVRILSEPNVKEKLAMFERASHESFVRDV